ncbi:hypothetical protein T492DRAFT_1048739 [Pavlovales sp. CCMP2436]|nr:hypothetical protein T492DRAFT_1048739 [Pavlovales sp. CCMP2436]|mmetsp:Transcript_13469/g.31840  ORF Transcript_13469/g.31840 Transcript_13469/m.31840 type:complete len:176 (+) Transcript_13469:72-599(+)
MSFEVANVNGSSHDSERCLRLWNDTCGVHRYGGVEVDCQVEGCCNAAEFGGCVHGRSAAERGECALRQNASYTLPLCEKHNSSRDALQIPKNTVMVQIPKHLTVGAGFAEHAGSWRRRGVADSAGRGRLGVLLRGIGGANEALAVWLGESLHTDQRDWLVHWSRSDRTSAGTCFL